MKSEILEDFMKFLILISALTSTQFASANLLKDTFKKFDGEYRLVSEDSVKRFECRKHFTIKTHESSDGPYLNGGLKFSKKSRHQQYVKIIVRLPGENISSDAAVIEHKSVTRVQTGFFFGKRTNVFYTKFDSRASDYGKLTYLADAKTGSFFEGYRSHRYSFTLELKNEGITVNFHKIANKKKAKLGKKLATCNYSL